MTRIHIEQGDITTYAVDAIVNAANSDLILGGGLARTMAEKGGPAMQNECHRIGSIGVGKAAITTAGNLPARFVIHQASMALGHATTAEALRDSTAEALRIAEEQNLRTIAFPAIGTGIGGFDTVACAEIMLSAVRSHLRHGSGLTDIYFVLYDRPTFDTFQRTHTRFRMADQDGQ
jgi:O-acetyl-ADP-ribose deacetylase (regulator of RNase III)